MKRKIIYLFTLVLMSVMLISCKDKDKKVPEQTEEGQEGTGNNEGESTEEENNNTENEKPDDSSGNSNENEEQENESNSEEEKPLGITDRAVITGMASDILANMTLEEKVGQLFIVNLELLDHSQGNYYEFRDITEGMKKTLQKYNIGGVCLFTRNIETREQTTKLIQDMQGVSKFPMFITVDEEGGDVARIANNDNMQTTKFPTMEAVGSLEDKEYAFNLGDTIGREIRELGFNVDFAPIADVKTNVLNTEIGSRSFGSDPKLVASMVREVVTGLQGQGISATLKHFPGHGDAADDSHKGAVNVENDIERLRDVEFVPFKAGIKAGVDFVMISHISISRITEDTIPASLSSLIYNEMIRTELGFEGLTITDAMNMKAITDQYAPNQASKMAFTAGADVLLMPEKFIPAYKSILQAVKNGSITEERLNASVQRILELKVKRGIIPEDTNLIPKKVEKVAE